MKVLCSNSEDPYHGLISRFIHLEFPHRLCAGDGNFLDIITAELIGSKQVRLGPKPSPETLVEIRKVISHYSARQLPIPFMVPWGSEKPDGSSIDAAELIALKQLHDIHERVRRHYLPGLQIRVRVEDASAPHLFIENQAKARAEAAVYTAALVNLNRILGFSDCITIVPESSLITEAQFNETADTFIPTFQRALDMLESGNTTDADYVEADRMLKEIGFSGAPSAVTRNYYHERFGRLYPSKSAADRRAITARYYAGALARQKLKARSDLPEWEGRFADISFVPLIPGTGHYFSRRLFYRTLPLDQSSNHIPPWRAKGHLVIGEEDDVRVRLASFHFDTPKDLRPMRVELSDDVGSVFVQVDYTLTA